MRLTVMYGIDCGERVRLWGQTVEAPDIEWNELQLPEPKIKRYSPAPEIFPEVPDQEFTLFRSSCRELLSKEDFQIVDHKYKEVFETAYRDFTENVEDTTERISRLMLHATSESEGITMLRAYQAAYLAKGHFIKVNKDLLLEVTLGDSRRPYRESEWLILKEMFNTEASAVAALTQEYEAANLVHLLSLDKVMRSYVNETARQIHKRHKIYRMLTTLSSELIDPDQGRWVRRVATTLRDAGLSKREPVSTPSNSKERSAKLKLQIVKVADFGADEAA